MLAIPGSLFVTVGAATVGFNEITSPTGSGDPQELTRMLISLLSHNVYWSTIGLIGSLISFFSIQPSPTALPYKFRYPILLLALAVPLWACIAFGLRMFGIVGVTTVNDEFPSFAFVYMIILSLVSAVFLTLFLIKRKTYYTSHLKLT